MGTSPARNREIPPASLATERPVFLPPGIGVNAAALCQARRQCLKGEVGPSIGQSRSPTVRVEYLSSLSNQDCKST